PGRCRAWYAHLAGCLARPLTGAKLVLTTHSLEPHRPWKVEQLGSAYHATTWIERTAYENAAGVIAVSKAMKQDVQELYGVRPERVQVIHNGIDPDEYRPRQAPATLREVGVHPEVVIALYSHAAVFVCPSVYEPFGIINLEAMACETPVVAAEVGGIPEIVVPGETGTLVRFEAEGGGSPEPRDPDAYSRALAAAISELMGASERRTAMGKASRARVLANFSWKYIA